MGLRGWDFYCSNLGTISTGYPLYGCRVWQDSNAFGTVLTLEWGACQTIWSEACGLTAFLGKTTSRQDSGGGQNLPPVSSHAHAYPVSRNNMGNNLTCASKCETMEVFVYSTVVLSSSSSDGSSEWAVTISRETASSSPVTPSIATSCTCASSMAFASNTP